MELELHPDGPCALLLRMARTHARACIDADQDLVLKGVHPTSPGNYNLGQEHAIAERAAQQPTEVPAGPSRVADDNDAAVHRSAEDSNIQLDYQDQLDEDTNMSPV